MSNIHKIINLDNNEREARLCENCWMRELSMSVPCLPLSVAVSASAYGSFSGFLFGFLELDLQNTQKSSKIEPPHPEGLQKVTQRAPNSPKESPSDSQAVPKASQRAPKGSPRAPMDPPRPPKAPPRAPKGSPKGSKKAPQNPPKKGSLKKSTFFCVFS